jgi:hypothetical protein
MLGLGPLSFMTPWVLVALLSLPVLWWLLRVTPPAPKRIAFPAIRLLFGLVPREETPHRTPLWLLLLRLAIAGLLILALAGPLLNARPPVEGAGPLLIVVDNGWASAPRWESRAAAMRNLVAEAGRAGRPVALLATAPAGDGRPISPSGLMEAGEAARALQLIEPRPWSTDRRAAAAALEQLPAGALESVWLSDGIADAAGEGAGEPADGAERLALALRERGPLRVMLDPPEARAFLQRPPVSAADALTLNFERVTAGGEHPFTIVASDLQGRPVARETLRFEPGQRRTSHAIRLPVELRNRIASVRVESEPSAGATFLVDAQWRQRPIGVVSGGQAGEEETLVGELYYLRRALGPGTDLREGTIADLLQRGLAVLMLADVGSLTEEETGALQSWIERGGLLLRFAGPRLAQNADALLPVRLRGGDRTLGGALTWEQPAEIAPFGPSTPFAGLAVPPDVRIYRQVLAEPELSLGDKTWATLTDGTPLVTAEHRGKGWLVLVHTTANADWSNLALSGLFVQMLNRIVALSEGVAGEAAEASLPPRLSLDGFGLLGSPPPLALPAPAAIFDKGEVGPQHPPGFYGSETTQRALNLGAGLADFRPLGALPPGVAAESYGAADRAFDLQPWLLAAALLLFLGDLLISLALRGLLPRPRRAAAGAAMALILLCAAAAPLSAQETDPGSDDYALEMTGAMRLAFVRTDDGPVDRESEQGLLGLSLVLRQRTAVDVGAPVGIDLARDELAFCPWIYWPIAPENRPLTDVALQRVNLYLRNGGLILFDTRDGDAGTGMARFNELVRGLDIPALIPVPPDHVLTKAFYLLREFPGRWAGGTLWVEQGEGRVNDGVSSVVIGSNDWAAAWAIDDAGQPIYATVPGGQKQREYAYRFGVNLVMYALTGNYKSDQVHVPAILERLGQ